MRKPAKVLLVISAGVVLTGAVMFVGLLRHGLSALDEPTAIEAFTARLVRRWSMPADLRDAANPVAASADVLDEARAHWADHCAVCHGNDGRGRTTIGQRLYPPAPDMTLAATQELTDGELFAIVENGIRLSGMPGWGDGTARSGYGSWTLVHFVRHLPDLTPEEVTAMEALNPKSPEEWEQMRAEQEFLEGGPSEDPAGGAEQPASHPH